MGEEEETELVKEWRVAVGMRNVIQWACSGRRQIERRTMRRVGTDRVRNDLHRCFKGSVNEGLEFG